MNWGTHRGFNPRRPVTASSEPMLWFVVAREVPSWFPEIYSRRHLRQSGTSELGEAILADGQAQAERPLCASRLVWMFVDGPLQAPSKTKHPYRTLVPVRRKLFCVRNRTDLFERCPNHRSVPRPRSMPFSVGPPRVPVQTALPTAWPRLPRQGGGCCRS